MKFRKIIITILLMFLIFGLFGCNINNEKTGNDDNDDKGTSDNEGQTGKTDKKIDDIYIYAVNDFHGIVYEDGDSVGLSKMFGFLKTKKEENPDNTIIISSGDMFQGSALSSMSRGELVLDAMNYVGFDAMTLGNHEFDWGLSTITRFCDGNADNGEATFPFLGANIINKNTNKIADGLKPYTVIKRAGLTIGIIGLIGYGEESDILTSNVRDYTFTSELPVIKKYAKELRETEKCDIVLLSTHCDTSDINYTLADLKGSEKIDAVFNGHTHQEYYGEIARSDGSTRMPYVQSGSYGRYVGSVVLTYDYEHKKVTDESVTNLRAKNNCKITDSNIDNMFSKYQEYVDIANEELGVSGVTIYQPTGGLFCADSLVEKFDVDFGICNRGGIRGSGFPIYGGDMITYGDVFEIMPFENNVVIVELLGSVIINRLFSGADSYYFISTNVNVDSRTINGVKIDTSKYYKVATIDYLYEKPEQPFMDGKGAYNTSILFRDVIAEAVKNNVKENGRFSYYK